MVPQLISRESFADNRGYFEMLFAHSEVNKRYLNAPKPLQINLVVSNLGSIRGFHGSDVKNNHWKYITCVKGKIRDLVLDLRPNSATIGKIEENIIDSAKPQTLVIPPGFAHAMQSLDQGSIVIYGTNIEYADNKEFEISPLDQMLNVAWNNPFELSERDRKAKSLADYLATLQKGDF